MSVERKLLLIKLIGFLTGEISKTEIYEWALSVAVSRDYEELIKNDKLSEKIIQFLLDVDKVRSNPLPIKKIVEYLIACLEERKPFDEAQYNALVSDQPSKQGAPTPTSANPNITVNPASVPQSKTAASAPLESKEPPAKMSWITVVARVYIFLFITISLIMNLVGIFKPDFLLQPGEVPPVADDVWRDAFPHVFYAVTMLIALFLRGPKIVFFPLFFIAAWGMFFYWYSITMFILDHKWPLYYLVMLSPLLTLPPTLMFWIMLSRWFGIRARK